MKLLREALALGGILVQVWMAASAWPSLPERVPTHYGFRGQTDAWGGRGSVLLLPAVTLGLYLMLTVMSRFPRSFNYPVEITEENRPRVEAVALALIGWLKAELSLGFAYIEWITLRQAQGLADGLGAWFLPVDVGIIFGMIAIGVALILRAAKTPPRAV